MQAVLGERHLGVCSFSGVRSRLPRRSLAIIENPKRHTFPIHRNISGIFGSPPIYTKACLRAGFQLPKLNVPQEGLRTSEENCSGANHCLQPQWRHARTRKRYHSKFEKTKSTGYGNRAPAHVTDKHAAHEIFCNSHTHLDSEISSSTLDIR